MNGQLQGFVWIGGVPKGCNIPSGAWIADTWVHWVFTYDGSYLRLFKNGVEIVDAVAQTGEIDVTTTDLGVGATGTGTYPFMGSLDEVCIYNRALSPSEIETRFQKGLDFSSKLLAKVPKGTTQVIVTLSWQGSGSINVTIESESQTYTEDMALVYQKTLYSTSSGISDMLNIKRLTVSVTALASNEDWYVMLEFDDVEDYRITVEVQR